MQGEPRRKDLIAGECSKDALRGLRIERLRKDGSEDDVSRDQTHLCLGCEWRALLIMLPTALFTCTVQLIGHASRGGHHPIKHRSHTCLLECRLHQAALTGPDIPIGCEDALTQQGAEHLLHDAMFWEVCNAIEQDLAHQMRRIDHEEWNAG